MTNSNENEELNYEYVIRRLRELLREQSDSRIDDAVLVIKQQSAELEAARKEIERLTHECDIWRDKQKIKRIPEGWQLVPTEPNHDILWEMRSATMDHDLSQLEDIESYKTIYQAALSEAPNPEDE